MEITCRYCGKKIAEGTETFKKLKRILKSYDMYWFCKNDFCLKTYLDNGEMDRESEIKDLESNLKHGQDGSPLQELANLSMRSRLKKLKEETEPVEVQDR